MKKILLLILIFSIQFASAQNLKKANLLFEKRAYLDAAELFLKEHNKTQQIKEKLGDCYYFNTRMKQAAQWYKTAISKNSNTINPIFLYKYSQALKGISKFNESDEWLQKYYNRKQKQSETTVETLSYFETLNNNIKLPYTIFETSINSEKSDFGVSFYKNKIIFASTRNSNRNNLYKWNKQPYLDLYEATIDSLGNLNNVKPFSNAINTKMHEANAIFTKDGKTMYFTRNNFVDGKKIKDENNVTHLKIYKAELINNNWTNIKELPFCSDNFSVEHPALSSNEKLLYFSSDMPGTIGSFDLFEVDINTDGTYGTPKNLGPTINTEHREQFPYISSKNILYFASNGHFGLGGLDIFKSKISNNNFSKPINLSNKINSNLDDFAFIINEENETGYFSSNRIGGAGDDDIYGFKKEETNLVEGLILDKNTYKPIPGAKVFLLDKDNIVLGNKIVNIDSKYSFEVDENKRYKLKGTKDSYLSYEVEFSTDKDGQVDKNTILLLELFVDSKKEIIVKHGKKQIKHDPIYFDLNSSYLRKEAKYELRKVAGIMRKYPELTIICGSHTDSRASNHYNMWLSNKRAKRTVDYIVSKGISRSRITNEGFGETQLINECSNSVKCLEYKHQQNRRTEFVIVNPE